MIGDRVRALRENRGWTQAHLAEVSGVSARTIQRVESKHVYSGETAMALAAALGLDVQDLVAPGPAAAGEHWPLWPAPAPRAAALIAIALTAPGALMMIAIIFRNKGFPGLLNALASVGRWAGLVPNYWFLWPVPLLVLPAIGVAVVAVALLRIYGRLERGSIAATGVEIRWHPLAAAALVLAGLTMFAPAANLFGDMLARAARAPLD